MEKVVVIGGGAAGFFTAINTKMKRPDLAVIILEKTSKVLQKVKVSGGGRCNVTNGRSLPKELIPFYPRGGKQLYPMFKQFSTNEMRAWLDSNGVPTVVEADLRTFPSSNSSQTIIDCFLTACTRLGIPIQYQTEVIGLEKKELTWEVKCKNEIISCDSVVVSSGASGKFWSVLSESGLKIIEPVPSLFTFHIKDTRIHDLPGLAFQDVNVKVAGSKLMESGPLLITHWGMSGPAILKLSAWGARELAGANYQFDLVVNFTQQPFDECRNTLEIKRKEMPKKMVKNEPSDGIPRRYWERLMTICQIEEKVFGELSKIQINKLCEELTQAHFEVNGKSAFKEEFVTSGGVDLGELNLETMESRYFPGLFLAGEVIDIDALTGGFNFQACWSAGWLISEKIAKA